MAFKLSIEQGKGRGQAFDFDAETITIGRTEENDVVLYEQGVSRKHARISGQGGQYFVEDLESANGTLLNGNKVKREALKDGDTIGIGAVVFRFGSAASKGSKDVTAPKAQASKEDRTPTAAGPTPEKATSSGSVKPAAAPPPPGAPIFKPRQVAFAVSGALLIAIVWALLAGRTPGPRLDQCTSDTIRLDQAGIGSMVFSTTPESVCRPGKELKFGFVGQPRTRYLFSYSAFYTDMNGIEVSVNGAKKEGSPLAPTRRAKASEIIIDEKSVKVGKQEENVITFRSSRANWGIERLELIPLPIDSGCLDQATEYFHLAEQLYEQKNVASSNLYNAFAYLRKARQCMEGLTPQPTDYVVVKQLIQTVNGELDKLCDTKLFFVKQKQNYNKYEEANDAFRYLLVAFPGDEHPCRAHVIDEIGGPQRMRTILGPAQ